VSVLRRARGLLGEAWYFLRDSTPSRRRQRYGDIQFDFDHNVNTTAAGVAWWTRLRGLLGGGLYQPTEESLFREMMNALPIAYERFTFIDIGSGKGRALLMAAEYPFRRIVGVELLPELHEIARENVGKVFSDRQRFELLCLDARDYEFPPESSVIYLFNPLHEEGLMQLMRTLSQSLEQSPREVWIVYHNPMLAHVIESSGAFERISGTHQYTTYRGKAA
jgi:SAM-dependent methyltransferase